MFLVTTTIIKSIIIISLNYALKNKIYKQIENNNINSIDNFSPKNELEDFLIIKLRQTVIKTNRSTIIIIYLI